MVWFWAFVPDDGDQLLLLTSPFVGAAARNVNTIRGARQLQPALEQVQTLAVHKCTLTVVHIGIEWYREALRCTERNIEVHREVQRDTEVQRGTERYREIQRGTERHREIEKWRG